jgi:threonine dehydrogenase-like Zn-dependent dehydrogenase
MTLLGSRNATAEDFQAVIGAIREGVPIDSLITHRTSLAAALRDIPRWATQKAGLIKALVDLS